MIIVIVIVMITFIFTFIIIIIIIRSTIPGTTAPEVMSKMNNFGFTAGPLQINSTKDFA